MPTRLHTSGSTRSLRSQVRDAWALPHARPARPLRAQECQPARRTRGWVPKPAVLGRGRKGRREGDRRLRSPRVAWLLQVPPLPNFLPCPIPSRRLAGAARAQRSPGMPGLLPSQPRSPARLHPVFHPGQGRLGSGRLRGSPSPEAGVPAKRSPPLRPHSGGLEAIWSSRKTRHRDGQPLAQGHTARRREAGVCRRRSPRGRLTTFWYSQPVLPSSSRTSSDAEWAVPMVRGGARGAPRRPGTACAPLRSSRVGTRGQRRGAGSAWGPSGLL